MKRFRLFALTLFAVFALGSIAATMASAELPEASEETFEFKSEGAKATLETTAGTAITCEKSESSGTIEKKLGKKVKFHFSGCKSGVSACNSLGDAKELILFEAEVHLVTVLLAGVLLLGLMVLLPATLLHLECAGGIVLILVLGDATGEFTDVKEKVATKKGTLVFARELNVKKEPIKGLQAIRTCDEPAFCEKGTKEFLLKAQVSKTEELASEETTVTVNLNKAIEFKF